MERRAEKFKAWVQQPYNFILLAVIILAIILRIYYFFQAYNQPLWWDEAEYMSTAKVWAFGIDYHIVPSRVPLLPMIAFVFFKLGLSEIAMKFVVELGASIGLVIVTFFLTKEMFNKKVAIITTFMMAVFWLGLFNTFRLHTDIPVMFLQYLALFFFWKGYINKKSTKHIILFSLFFILALMMKPTAGLLLITIVLFLFITQQFSILKEKKLWTAFLFLIIFMLPYFAYTYISYGNPLIFLQGSHVFEDPSAVSSKPLGWNVLSYPLWFTEWPIFILFIIGAVIALIEVFLKLDFIVKQKTKESYAELFMILLILVYLIYFVFIERQAPEDRWVMPMVIAMFAFSSKAIVYIFDAVKKYNKQISFIVVLIILVAAAYFQLSHANSIIMDRKNSYVPVKLAALWIKENSLPTDSVMSVSYTQTIFYSERKTFTYPPDMNETGFLEFIQKNKPRYLIVSIFEMHHPQWMYNMPQKFLEILEPVKAYAVDGSVPTQQNPTALIVYEFKGYNLSQQSSNALNTSA